MTRQSQEYHLGTSDEELERLGYQHQVWLEEAVALWQRAGFAFGHTLLDLGCGPGFATLDLANLVGKRGTVHAVDASEKFLAHLTRQLEAARLANVVPHKSDVHRLPLPDASVDGAFARWLMCFVRSPEQVTAEVARVLRPGGALVVIDYFNYQAVKVSPARSALQTLFDGYYRSAIANGGSYDIGERLPGILIASGLEVAEIRPICRIARPGSPIWRWIELFNQSYSPKLVEQGILSEESRHEILTTWEEAKQDPSTFIFPPPMLGIIAQKPTG